MLIFQGEIFVGDQNGKIHIWDLKKDSSEHLVIRISKIVTQRYASSFKRLDCLAMVKIARNASIVKF